MELLGIIGTAGVDGRDGRPANCLTPRIPGTPLIHHWENLMYSVEPEQVSTLDAARYDDSRVNLPVEEDMARSLRNSQQGLPIRLGTEARRVAVHGSTVRSRRMPAPLLPRRRSSRCRRA